MSMRIWVVGSRLSLGLATLVAVVWQALVLAREDVFDPINYLSYFTNLSNIVAAIILVISAIYLLVSRKPSPRDDLIRGAATLYMSITGLVYVTLLTGEDLGLLLPWVNILLHIIMPIAVLADWLYRPPRSLLPMRLTSLWLVFPGVFLVYSLIRGAIIDWYPYPFLNPAKTGGYIGVTMYCAIIFVAFCLLAWIVMKIGNSRKSSL